MMRAPRIDSRPVAEILLDIQRHETRASQQAFAAGVLVGAIIALSLVRILVVL